MSRSGVLPRGNWLKRTGRHPEYLIALFSRLMTYNRRRIGRRRTTLASSHVRLALSQPCPLLLMYGASY